MKTNIRKQNAVALFIYLLALGLMSWSFNARAEETAKTEVKKVVENPELLITTSVGKITIRLDAENAPVSTENFLKYVEKKHYDGTIFHRVIKDFMIQGGGMKADMSEKDTMAPIKNEAKNGLSNLRGTIAMARTNEVDSATSQFFINTVDNKRLDHVDTNRYGYAVFGKVTEGLDVVDKIREVKTTSKNGHDDVPASTITIKSIRLIKKPVTKEKK